ncbi:D-ribose transporter ATP-binding protein [Paenibacillus darwinianus]|uniref:D-ribose transporter ATP-binding protein n=1 Tax=Paenibacillus darwinianus TaxID=1380763 RepID=A0A9W5S0P7_9BACL|nr:sugar ABC transporter ATP-binding protein [Paenibacillus darwinianus]EXX87057.1 D-ribose transporter ATP-binding protein [Paenibacillus darwinianus]EXX87127.1 D-ribose transporter ATP-binding protein [Paenibacillus darwinianus]EXX87264.1 D-ribose transporter ATP-binding protein [Paenibacillus darwinianus]
MGEAVHAAARSAPLLEMRDIAKSYNGIKVLNGINLTVNPGEVLALVGENGAGKSTLIKILSGAITADTGDILIEGDKVLFQTPHDAEQSEIVTVYQELNLFAHLSVAENLFFSRHRQVKGMINWKKMNSEAKRFLEDFGVYLKVDQPVSRLSIAEKQMLEIAKALHRKARVMILDEPTAVLGGDDVGRLLQIVRRLRDRGVAVIFISHRLDEIFGLADRYLVLKDGHQVDDGSIGDTTPDDLVGKMVGRQITAAPRDKIRTDAAPKLLRVENLSRKGVLTEIHFSLHAGEVLGIAGLRGSGRTELVRAIFGADPVDSGVFYIRGSRVDIGSPGEAVRKGIGLVPEDRGNQGLFKNLSASHNMFMASKKIKWIYPREEQNTASGFVDSLQIKLAHLGVPVGSLSGGNQQKVVLAKWLETGVDILLLDEPTRGIDVGSKAQIYSVVRDLCKQGMGIILISSELTEILENSHRILVMSKGRITGELDRETATEELIMKYAVGGSSNEKRSE